MPRAYNGFAIVCRAYVAKGHIGPHVKVRHVAKGHMPYKDMMTGLWPVIMSYYFELAYTKYGQSFGLALFPLFLLMK